MKQHILIGIGGVKGFNYPNSMNNLTAVQRYFPPEIQSKPQPSYQSKKAKVGGMLKLLINTYSKQAAGL